MTKEEFTELLTRLANGRMDAIEQLVEVLYPLLEKPLVSTDFGTVKKRKVKDEAI